MKKKKNTTPKTNHPRIERACYLLMQERMSTEKKNENALSLLKRMTLTPPGTNNLMETPSGILKAVIR